MLIPWILLLVLLANGDDGTGIDPHGQPYLDGGGAMDPNGTNATADSGWGIDPNGGDAGARIDDNGRP
ncbi:MAG TPA: hypothetical protein VHW00_01055 [Thermoanaerobaculia bacterium]|nr:hypothetical protein [Thermoanaerobaculia bacterium]